MKRLWKLLLPLGAALAVYLGLYGFLLLGGQEPLRLETLSGDPSLLAPYEISFSLIEPQRREQRYTLREGVLTQKDRFLETDSEWKIPVVRNTYLRNNTNTNKFGDSGYLYWKTDREMEYFVLKKAWTSDRGQEYAPGIYPEQVYRKPILTLGNRETIEGFWVTDEGFYCAVKRRAETELRQYDAAGKLLKSYPFDSVPKGYFIPAHESTLYYRVSRPLGGWVELEDFLRDVWSEFPPEPDGAEIFPLDGGRVLMIGAWTKEGTASGIDLYLLAPGELLYHGRIATGLWKDRQAFDGEVRPIGYPDADAPIRYFTLPEVKECP